MIKLFIENYTFICLNITLNYYSFKSNSHTNKNSSNFTNTDNSLSPAAPELETESFNHYDEEIILNPPLSTEQVIKATPLNNEHLPHDSTRMPGVGAISEVWEVRY